MARLTAAEFKAMLMRDLPQALAPGAEPHATNGHSEREPAKKGERSFAQMLVTEDAVLAPERLPEVARYLRDRLGYELLSNITAVDYMEAGLFEVVYHFAHLSGGVLVVKVRVPREQPLLPSLVGEWPGADFQEREAFDMYGVRFSGHPDLRRIYMWDEFEGFPMRKDFPKQGDKYFEEE